MNTPDQNKAGARRVALRDEFRRRRDAFAKEFMQIDTAMEKYKTRLVHRLRTMASNLITEGDAVSISGAELIDRDALVDGLRDKADEIENGS